jgi:hypothetical protein
VVKHEPIERWVDFVRGLVPDADRFALQQHLDSGCRQCLGIVERLSLTGVSLREAEVPDAVLDRALKLFPRLPSESPNEGSSRLRRLVAVLTFDSLSDPLPSGVRGGGSAARRLAYQAEDLAIDVLVDTDPVRRSAALSGQVSSVGPDTTGSGGPSMVQLISRKATLQETECTAFGEFQFEFDLKPGLSLVIVDVQGRRQVELPLEPLLRTNARTQRKPSKSTGLSSEDL